MQNEQQTIKKEEKVTPHGNLLLRRYERRASDRGKYDTGRCWNASNHPLAGWYGAPISRFAGDGRSPRADYARFTGSLPSG